jgi:hypothetical protein
LLDQAAVQATADALQAEVTDPQTQQNVANAVQNGAWGTLLALGLAAAAAIGGGVMGAKAREDERRVTNATA